jgi:hypothetical protein
MDIIFLVLITYSIGFLFSLIILHIFGKNLVEADYDEQPNYEADWDSNAEAYFGWSCAWVFFWFILSLFGLFKLGVKLSTKIGGYVKINK